MAGGARANRWIALRGRALGVAAVLILLVVLSIVRFPNLLVVAAGLALGVVWINRFRLASRVSARRWATVAFAALAGLVLIGIPVGVWYVGVNLYFPRAKLSDCVLTIQPLDLGRGTFQLQASATYADSTLEAAHIEPQPMRLPPQDIQSSRSAGILSRIVEVPKPTEEVPLTVVGISRTVMVDFSTCGELSVRLRHFPAGTFYQAENPAETPQPHPFGNTEDTSWKVVRSGDPSVRFSYVPPPFNGYRTTLQPLIGLGSLGSLLDLALGFLITKIPFGKVFEWIRNRLKRSEKTQPPAAPPAAPATPSPPAVSGPAAPAPSVPASNT